MRKLASIRTITDIQPIPNKDRIVLAIVDGWSVIVKKDEYNIGDKTIFVEPDSVLPEKPEFEFLRKNNFRIKTMKMSGVISQGICFPLEMLPKGNYEVGQDVTNLMEIKQYERTMDIERENTIPQNKKITNPILKYLLKYKIVRKLLLPPKQNKGFPDFISKTDETRIQNMPFVLHNKDVKYLVREKIDGQSGTFFLQKAPKKWYQRKQQYDFGVCSRNLRLWNENDGSSQWFVAKKYNLKSVLEDLIGDNEFVAIQGECVAPKVQGNKYKVSEPDLYAFNLIYPNGKVDCLEGERTLNKYNIKWCPLVDVNFELPNSVKEVLEYANGTSKIHNTLREGLVFRNYSKNISFKAVSPDWLIKNDE